jgi:hypothetical protein
MMGQVSVGRESMAPGDVYLITERVKRVPPRALDALERTLGTSLPLGYREYLTQLGVGRFSGFLIVYTPQQVKQQLGYWRQTLAEVTVDGMGVGMYSRSVLSAKKIREAFPVAHTDNGDLFVSTPSCGQGLFVIPRDSARIRSLRRGFLDPKACCRAVDVDAGPWFEAANGRRRITNFGVRGGAAVVEKVLTELWGKREIRSFGKCEAASWGSVVSFGVRAIEGLVKVYSRPRGGHVVTVSFDKDVAGEVRAFAKTVGVSRPAK